MARLKLDETLNADLGQQIAKINRMLEELYGDSTNTSQTTSGLTSTGSLQLDTGTKTASATAGAATLNKDSGVITSEALTTAAGAAYTLTLTDSAIAAADIVLVSVQNGTNTQGDLAVGRVTPAAGSVSITINNRHASQALNGTIKIAFAVLKN